MKKILIASGILIISLVSAGANAASITITNMIVPEAEELMAATGELFEFGGGSITGIDTFLGNTWSATQKTAFMNNTGAWSGDTGGIDNPYSAFNYDDEILAMSAEQIAVGLYWHWNGTDTAVLAIFDCLGTVENPVTSCTGASPVLMDNGQFIGVASVGFNAVPVPAAAWLMGSGLLGLVGVARRRKAA